MTEPGRNPSVTVALAGAGMQLDVRGGALDHPQQGVPDVCRDRPRLAGDQQPDARDVLRGRLQQGFGQRRRFQPGGGELMDQAARVREVPAQHPAGLEDVLARGRAGPGPVRGFQEEQAAGQALRHGVVDFPGHPLAFLDGARPALAGRQPTLGQRHLGVQPPLLRGVLLDPVVDQRQHNAHGQRPQEHGNIAAAAEPEQPDGGGRRRRAAPPHTPPAAEGGTAQEEERKGAPREAGRRDHQHRPERYQDEHPHRPRPPAAAPETAITA